MSVYNLVDSSWELTDPNPDIFALFVEFNNAFFDGALGSVEIKWSRRMTLCAGLCRYAGRAGCTVVLSEKLLKLRPRKDLIETLLHEMIHAYLFVADRNRERDAHGPKFIMHMRRINNLTGTNITVYHSFHDEVSFYKTHVWKCNGPCQSRPPYFGTVSRAMNRAPGPSDFWHADHQRTCGGSFTKISGPDPPKKTPSVPKKGINKLPAISGAASSSQPISQYFPPIRKDKPSGSSSTSTTTPTATYTPTAAAAGSSNNSNNYPRSSSSSASASATGLGNHFFPNNTKENQGKGKPGVKFKFPTRGGMSSATGSRTITVVTLDDDDDDKSDGRSGNTLNNTNHNSSRPPSQIMKPEPKPDKKPPTSMTTSTTFVPFSGKGYTLGSGGGAPKSSGIPYKKPKY